MVCGVTQDDESPASDHLLRAPCGSIPVEPRVENPVRKAGNVYEIGHEELAQELIRPESSRTSKSICEATPPVACVRVYSSRNATMGSIRAARRAGIQLDPTAITAMAAVMDPKSSGSSG